MRSNLRVSDYNISFTSKMSRKSRTNLDRLSACYHFNDTY